MSKKTTTQIDLDTEQPNTPCQINLELSSTCNHKCPYCYNSWRHDNTPATAKMSIDKLDILIDDIIKNKVFNVILTGGEPFTNYEGLLHSVKRLSSANVLVTCNTNLTLATAEQLKELKAAGLPHILTSLASFDPDINDSIFGNKGAFVKITKNIINATSAGIKVSVNNIIHGLNKEHVYRTGLLAHTMGASNFFVTRAASSKACGQESSDFVLTADDYHRCLSDAIRVHEETGIIVSSLSQYPVCFLRDVEKYADFLARLCPCGNKMVCVNADGSTHACNHETRSYGNVWEVGLTAAWKQMSAWRDGSYIPPYCQSCKWFRWCGSGCRQCSGKINEQDFLFRGRVEEMPDPIEDHVRSMPLVTDVNHFTVKKGLRYREETNMWLFHTVGSFINRVSKPTGAFLADCAEKDRLFTLKEFPDTKEVLATLLTKNVVELASR